MFQMKNSVSLSLCLIYTFFYKSLINEISLFFKSTKNIFLRIKCPLLISKLINFRKFNISFMKKISDPKKCENPLLKF